MHSCLAEKLLSLFSKTVTNKMYNFCVTHPSLYLPFPIPHLIHTQIKAHIQRKAYIWQQGNNINSKKNCTIFKRLLPSHTVDPAFMAIENWFQCDSIVLLFPSCKSTHSYHRCTLWINNTFTSYLHTVNKQHIHITTAHQINNTFTAV